MKIEMGESLFYSWLRHVKECQIVQTNWKTSQRWVMGNEDDLQRMWEETDRYFRWKYNYKVFKLNSSLAQILRQAECDVLGISIQNGVNKIYAVDVAFHEFGLNYGTKEETITKVISKTARTAMCLWGYLGVRDAEVIFASPKIHFSLLQEIEQCIQDLNDIFQKLGYEFKFRLISNKEFNYSVLQPILLASKGVADTSELFLRSYQMYSMFFEMPLKERIRFGNDSVKNTLVFKENDKDESIYKELKIGKLVQLVLREMLIEGKATEQEVMWLQQADYSKEVFDLQYPLLVKSDSDFDKVRYYKEPLVIRGESYLMCSQWFETPANNDRPYLLNWIESHK
ncbi:MAG: hypothetical protein Q4A29_06925 [Eubacteriales bacterium]|nr:hypothetical protein [Eubacteriales bacterium]